MIWKTIYIYINLLTSTKSRTTWYPRVSIILPEASALKELRKKNLFFQFYQNKSTLKALQRKEAFVPKTNNATFSNNITFSKMVPLRKMLHLEKLCRALNDKKIWKQSGESYQSEDLWLISIIFDCVYLSTYLFIILLPFFLFYLGCFCLEHCCLLLWSLSHIHSWKPPSTTTVRSVGLHCCDRGTGCNNQLSMRYNAVGPSFLEDNHGVALACSH